MTQKRKPFELSGELSGLPAERVLHRFCRIYLSEELLDDPDWRPDPAFMRDLMRWFAGHAPPPQRRLTNAELALFVDYLASRYFTVTKASELVAHSEKRSVESVTRAHQRHGIPAKELKARREAWQQAREQVELEAEHVARFAKTGLAEALGTRRARTIAAEADAQPNKKG